MNDHLNVERPSGFRNAIYAMMGSMVIFGVSTIWYGSQIEARFDARLIALEQQQTLSHALMDKLNDAREESRVHGAQVDGKLNEMTGKLSTILETMLQLDTPANGGIPNGGPENFQRQPPKGHGQ